MPKAVQLPNGSWFPLLENEDPTDALIEAQKKYPEAFGIAPPKPAKELGAAGFSLRDLATSFGLGAVGGTKALTDVAGADNVASQQLQRASQALQETFTPERQAELQRQQRRMQAAEKEGTLAEIGAGLRNVLEAPLQSTAQAIGSFVPYLPALFAAPAAAALRLAPGAVRAVTAAADAAPAVIGTAQGLGAVKGSIYEGVLRAEIEAGTPENVAQAKAVRAQEYFGNNFEQIALGGALGYGAARFGAERLLTPGGRQGLPAGLGRRVGTTAVAEAGTEAAQAAQERVAQNLALQREGFDVPTFQGAAGAATQEGLMGALGGAPVAAFARPTAAPVAPQAPFVEEPAPPAPPSELQTAIERTTGVAAPAPMQPMSLEEARIARMRKAQEDIDAAVEQEQERARRFGPRPSVPVVQPMDTGRMAETMPMATPMDRLLEKQRQVDERRLAAGLPTSTGVMPEGTKPERPREPKIVDNRPLNEQGARNRLMVMQDMLKNEGGDPNSLAIIPHPTAKGRFAITSLDRPVELTPGLPETAITKPPAEPIIDPVDAYVNRARATNTPAAMRFVRDYDDGRITRADVERALEAERQAGRPLPFTYTETGEPGIVAPGGFKARAPATETQIELKRISDSNSDFAVDNVVSDGKRQFVASATPTLDTEKRLPLVLTSAEQSAADAIQDRLDASTTAEERTEAEALLRNTLRRALSRNLADVDVGRFQPPTAETPPVEPPPTEPPPTEPPPPTVEPPKSAAELAQRLPVLRQNPEVEAANKAGNFGALIDALAKSSNPVVKKIAEISQKYRNKITLKKAQRSFPRYPNAIGLYNSGEDSIVMRSDYAGDESTSVHEIVHGLTVKSMLAPNARQQPIVKEIEALYQYVKVELAKKGMGWDGKKRPRKFQTQVYGMADAFEFVSEANSNPDFQFLLMNIPYKGNRSAWTQFTRLVANLLGIKDVNALTEIINLTDKLTAIPGRGSLFGQGKGQIFERAEGREVSPIGFYSALSDAVSKSTVKAAPVDGWKAMFKGMVNKGVVKQNELEWTGINDWLDLQQGRVTKDQVKEYLDANGVQVEETVLGRRNGERPPIVVRMSQLENALDAGDATQEEIAEYRRLSEEVRLNGLPETPEILPTKYGQYTLPGGKNYREVLLTLPVQQTLEDRYAEMRGEAGNVYRSRHWDQPNVLAHIRVNDRTDADGNKVLFIEEIQSDWGQEGKKKGFAGKLTGKNAEYQRLYKQFLDNTLPEDQYDYFYELQDELGGGIEAERGSAIPTAPFVIKTEGWLNLALKRIMIMAAEGGYDKVAFVNGEQSANRYDLSKSIDRIDAKRRPNGTYEIDVSTKEGKDFNRSGLTPEELEDNVGKEMAQKIIDATASDQKRVRFSGLDLKVGGEGMKTFYDKIVPSALNKLLPKLGGGKMSTIDIRQSEPTFNPDTGEKDIYDYEPQPGFDITSEMRDKVDEGIELFSMEREPEAPPKVDARKEMAKAEGTPAQQAAAILEQTGMQQQAEEPNRVKNVLESLRKMGENPQLTKESAKATLKQWTDKLETMAFSGDAAFNNDIRRNLMADLNEHPEVIGMLLEASQSQAVHADALATQFIVDGGIAYDSEAKKWVSVKKEDNFIKLSQSIDALAAKYKISKQEAERIAHTHFVAKRFKSLAAKQDRRNTEIADLEEKINKVNGDIRRETDANKRDRLYAERDGYRKQVDDLKKAKVLISDDQRAMIDPGMRLAEIMPELKDISDIWQGIRTNAVKALMDGQLWSIETAEDMLDNVDYVPFYRDEQLEAGGGPLEFIRGLQVKAEEFRLKGSNAPVHDVFDNMVRWSQYAVNRSVRNHKALQMIDLGKEIKVGDAKMATKVDKMEPGKNIVRVFRNGQQELYEVADPLYMDAFTSISNVAIPSIKFFSWFADMLRNSVVLYPLFSVAQVPQDAFSAMFTSGLKPRFALKIPMLAVKEFVKTLTKTSQTHNLLKKYGATGVRDFSAAVARMDVEIAAGLKPPKTITGKGIELLSHIAMSADNAIRQAVYEASMQQGLSKAEAIEKAFDIINFRRRGSSKMINLLGQVVPFFYAYMSVQRVAMKTITGTGISPSNRMAALSTLATMSGGLMAMSMLYAMLVAEDEDYQDTPTAVRDRVLVIPGTGLRIPLRPDMFLMPKVLAEHTYHLLTDNGMSDAKKARTSMFDALVNAVSSPTPVPQAIKPVLEVAVNYDFFQGKPVVGFFEKQKEAERQFTDATSEFSKILGKAGASPIVADHLIRGMFGSVGGLFLYTTNFMINNDSAVERPSVSVKDMIASVPGTGGFVGKSTENALKNDFYLLRDEVAKAKATYNDIKVRSPQGIEEFLADEKNVIRLKMARTTEKIADELSKIRRAISQVNNAPSDLMTPEQKGEKIEELRRVEKEMLKAVDVKGLRALAQL
jgi:23S rRNA maturation mini-RNase III